MTAAQTGDGRRIRHVPRSRIEFAGMAVVSAVLLGTVLNFGSQFAGIAPRSGYHAGVGDHDVLSPLGIHWADREAFAGDWFMLAAPQPHWFFDAVTAFGRATGAIEIVYLVYWCLALLAFGFATAMLARRWARERAWFATIAVTVVAGLTPWMTIGTGTGMISQAIPAVLSANLLYLLVAALVCGRFRSAAVIAPVIAIVHVQQGAVAAVVLAALIAVDWMIAKRPHVWMLVGLGVTAALVVFGLRLRPVAANPGDFVEVCNELIPYHCASDQWGTGYFFAGLGAIALAAATVLLVRSRAERLRWCASVGLMLLGITLGMLLDRFDVPVLGELSQSVNVYRLGAGVVPFAVFGVTLMLIRRFDRPVWQSLALLAGWAVLVRLWWLDGAWQFGWKTWTLAALVVVAGLVQFGPKPPRPGGGTVRVLTWLALVALLANGFASGRLQARPLDIAFIPDASLKAWGEEVRTAVPAGSQVLVPPRAGGDLKLAMERGILADCKNIPYGGEPLREWRERLDAVGGWEQCRGRGGGPTAEELTRAADEYGMSYLVTSVDNDWWPDAAALADEGWRVVETDGAVPWVLMERE